MAEIKKILIVRFSSIGDIVLTTPVVRTLKKQLHDIELHYLTKAQYVEILESNPYLSRIHTLQDDWGKMVHELKNEKFDLIIDLHFNLRTRLLKWNLRVPSYSFDKINLQKWLKVNLKIDRLPKVHIVDRYMKTVASLGVKNDDEGLDYFIPDPDRINITNYLPLTYSRFNVYAIGGQHATKKYPEEMIRNLVEKHNNFLVLLGGPEDTEAGERIATGLNHVINLCGKLNINQSASVISQAHHVITHDTGMMHIAAAFNKPIASLWGNTVPEFGMSPYLPVENSKIFEITNLPCRPCSKIGYSQCPKGHFKCMTLIDPDEIIQSIRE